MTESQRDVGLPWERYVRVNADRSADIAPRPDRQRNLIMVGVVSNSDGRADALAVAMEVFIASGCDLVIHCGDVGGRHVLDEMSRMDASFVWGDRDHDRMGLLRYAQKRGVDCFGMMGEMCYDEKMIGVVHGDDKKLLTRLTDEQQYDYLLCGHGMAMEDRTVGRTRIINPGPLHGAINRSAILLDPVSGEMKIITL